MSLDVAVRPMLAMEKSMCLSNWKLELFAQRPNLRWCRGLEERDYWCLVNHVLDRITFPSCLVFVGCHESDIDTPVCWVAIRKIAGLSTYEIVYLYARKSVRDDPELAATLERALLSKIDRVHPLATERRPFNLFLELRR